QQLEALAPVQQAVFEGRRVRLVYERRGGVSAERVLDPIGLIVAGDTWYLVAASEGVERMYRVSRMSGVVVLDDPAQR
ncbi:WYL domain-containing protein, partial [Streptomyces sp. SID10244]|nr:WYL domain-containing protein [Streptomyces sp. SID10244]